jgi:ribonuclease D
MHYFNIDKIPNVFCTKISSKLCRTYTNFHGLKSLCKNLLFTDLNKESQQSNWGAKVLERHQLNYAAQDVIYLHRLRAKCITLLQESGRYELALNCFESLHNICQLDLLDFGESVFQH